MNRQMIKCEEKDKEMLIAYLRKEPVRNTFLIGDIWKRLETGEGTHYLIEKEDVLVAQINSAAATPYSAMIGGLFTNISNRGNGLASYLVDKLSEKLVDEGKIPCLISNYDSKDNLFLDLGFEKIGEFTTLEPKTNG